MCSEQMAPNLEKPTVLTAEESLRFRVRRLIDAFNGPFGKIVAGLIAEGQSEPAVLQEFFDHGVSPRRTATIADLQRAKNAGELQSEIEPELLNDAIFGAIYYRLLLRSGPSTRRLGEEVVAQVLRGQRAGPCPRSLGLIGETNAIQTGADQRMLKPRIMGKSSTGGCKSDSAKRGLY
jgi:hypothetical protein